MLIIGVLILGYILFWSKAKNQNVRDYDCSDFSNQAEAQRFFENQGGPVRDPHRLDRDRDGIACETL